jgi:hypothetical protein
MHSILNHSVNKKQSLGHLCFQIVKATHTQYFYTTTNFKFSYFLFIVSYSVQTFEPSFKFLIMFKI